MTDLLPSGGGTCTAGTPGPLIDWVPTERRKVAVSALERVYDGTYLPHRCLKFFLEQGRV